MCVCEYERRTATAATAAATATATAAVAEQAPRSTRLKPQRRNRQRPTPHTQLSRRSFNATEYRERARAMFTFAYDSYMQHAFPHDELAPLRCAGRSADPDTANINVNDALGNYSLTLIDTLDTLALMGNVTEFWRAVSLVVDTVSFDRNVTVQVFEANIRVLGGLLSAHMFATDARLGAVGESAAAAYRGELLHMAQDIASRLLPAFDATGSALPYPRVNLLSGVPRGASWRNDTNTAAAGTLILEFGVLR